MTFDKWFEEQALWLKIVLLIIPFVGWVVEILIRVSAVIRKSSTLNIVGLVIGKRHDVGEEDNSYPPRRTM